MYPHFLNIVPDFRFGNLNKQLITFLQCIYIIVMEKLTNSLLIPSPFLSNTSTVEINSFLSNASTVKISLLLSGSSTVPFHRPGFHFRRHFNKRLITMCMFMIYYT